MRRQLSHPNPSGLRVSGDRWLFGYADVVTLLFACFATLYAGSLAGAKAAAPETEVDPVPVTLAAPEVHAPDLAALLGDAVDLPGVEMISNIRGLVISLPEASSFPAGRAELSPVAMGAMRELATRLRTLPNQIRVEGHTDDLPIATSLFRSNWELSTARATRVVQFLIDEGRLGPERLSAAGYAEHRPKLPNASAAARARNRRVDIVVLDPSVASREEPGAFGQ
jgi:chemotaxis protein MotB